MVDQCRFDVDGSRADAAATLTLTQELRSSKKTVAAMESCTGGMLTSVLTQDPGSGFVLGGIVAYDARIKAAFGVPMSLIESHGVVSSEVAVAMAARARAVLGADLGIGITGEAGPAPDSEEAPGTVFVATVTQRLGRSIGIRCKGDRGTVRFHAVLTAITLALATIEEDAGAAAGIEQCSN
ncbi:MAG TPA: nicotinamide-nucleotide amidohydrolase family protein [Tepidiformaceae bacterium]|nr:nicotinamide-nucleotide amidohydrolase family protein [Tepidiformaceae bacterium]